MSWQNIDVMVIPVIKKAFNEHLLSEFGDYWRFL